MVHVNKFSRVGRVVTHPAGLASGVLAAGPSTQFLWVGSVGMLGVLCLSYGLIGGSVPIGMATGAGIYGLGIGLAIGGLRAHYPHGTIGLCNMVTVTRLMMAAALGAALLGGPVAPWPVFAVAALAFAMDGVDGWLARREGLASDFGARFDMEVDSLLALVLALLAYQAGHVTGLILILGVPRYAFWLAQFPCPWLAGDLPPRFSRKVVCVSQIAALLIALVPILAPWMVNAVVGAVAVALLWSFALDIRWLRAARP